VIRAGFACPHIKGIILNRERKLNVAKALATQLHTAEEAIDTALSEAANLIEAYVSSRRAVHMSTIVANDVHQNTLKAMLALNDAQRHMSQAHEGLVVVKDYAGLATATLPANDKPPPPPPGGGGGVTSDPQALKESA
jgi:enamine deaminase RidA (YjgF/YER057c/UK114 family)